MIWRRTERAGPRPEVDVTPDATIRELTKLPGVVSRWLEADERVA